MRSPGGLVPEAGSDQGIGEVRRRVAPDALVIQVRALATYGRVTLTERRHAHNTDSEVAVDLDADAHRPARQPVEIVDGAVDRVDKPTHPRRPRIGGPLLGEHAVVWSPFLDPVDDQPIGWTIRRV